MNLYEIASAVSSYPHFFLSFRSIRLREEQGTFLRYGEFWLFCINSCTDFKLGCAKRCRHRERLAIPPFSKSYAAKLKGKIGTKES